MSIHHIKEKCYSISIKRQKIFSCCLSKSWYSWYYWFFCKRTRIL